MKERTRFIAIGIGTALAVLVFSTTLVRAVFYAPTEVEVPPSLQAEIPKDSVAPIQYPARLRVPSLSIDAAVEEVGITKSGNMAVPKSFSDVGWYKYGTVPGQRGSAVLAGHVDNALALAGVFKRLGEVQIGDEIYVDTKEGERLRFVVEDVQSYPYQEVPTEVLFNRDDAVRLNLITCGGSWIQSAKTYDERLVVYTRLASR
jgi:sortase A